VRISKQLRDDAATICAACASEPGFCGAARAAAAFGLKFAAIQLACTAWLTVADIDGGGFESPLAYAEAEAMLRTGWSP
jgi:hypothetical protein